MPRKDFVHDLQEASSTAELINLQNVRPGEDDGAIACTFSPHGEQEEPVDLQLLVSGKYLTAFSRCSTVWGYEC